MLHLTQDPTTSTAFFSTSLVNNALTDLLFCTGISSGSSDGSGTDVYKQIQAIVIVSLLLQEYKIEYIKNTV